MPVLVNCPQCDRKLRVPDELLGKMVKCPTCGTTFTSEEAGEPPLEEEAPAPRRPRPVEESYEEAPPRRPPERRQDDEEEEYDDEAPRQRRRRRSRSAAADMVSGPATGLLVSGILTCLLGALLLVINLAGVGMGAGVQQPGAGGPNPQLVQMLSGTMGAIMNLISIGLGILVIVGSQKMKNLESYGLALTASILTVIPCFTCCLWGLPLGIWALVVISKEEVKAAFQ
jgi:predicted Zn finger-like uncharacterized protein